MKDKRILSKFLAKKQEIKILGIYVFLLCGIVAIAYINNLCKHRQFIFQGAESTVLPIPNVEFLLNPPSKSFELSFFRFNDIQAGSKFVQIYVHLKLQSEIEAKKEIMMKAQISIMRSGWNRGYSGSVLENEKIYVNLTCADACKPQMIFDYEISPYHSDYMIAIEVLNPAELYNQGVEAFNTGVLTDNSAFAVTVVIIQILLYILSVIAFLLSILSLRNNRDPLYIRIFSLCGILVNSHQYILYNGRIRILIKEIIFTTHSALLTNLWLHSVEIIIGKKYNKLKNTLIAIIAITSFIVFHSLWNPPLTVGVCLLGISSMFILVTNFKKVMQSLWDDRALFLTVLTYLISYLFILIKGNFDFLANNEFNLLFNLINSLFTMLIVIIYFISDNRTLKAPKNLDYKQYSVTDLTVFTQSTTEK